MTVWLLRNKPPSDKTLRQINTGWPRYPVFLYGGPFHILAQKCHHDIVLIVEPLWAT